MAKIRTKRLEKQGISRERYQELLHISRQFFEQHGAGNPLAWRVSVIERAAAAAGEFLAPYILANVTEGRTFEQMTVPCGRNQFFQVRKRYFQELDRMLKEAYCAAAVGNVGRELSQSAEV